MNQPLLSVIICTHNPRLDYLDKVLKALYNQTLSWECWELLLIDNASTDLLAPKIDLSWHPQARHIREEKLGLTAARLRGIQESTADILIFVDDDNILDDNYLEEALKISKDYPFIGAWGGQIRGVFEVNPPEWTKPFLPFLAIREFPKDKWSNLPLENETTPCGAGMCIRRSVADKYRDLALNDPRRIDLGRKGESLGCSEDIDMALTACDLGLGMGCFTNLSLAHLMPSNRLNEEYLLRLTEGVYYSGTILKYLRGSKPIPLSRKPLNLYLLYLRIRYGKTISKFHEASQKGYLLALKKINYWDKGLAKNTYRNHICADHSFNANYSFDFLKLTKLKSYFHFLFSLL